VNIGEVWLCELQGRTPWTSKNAIGDYEGPVRIEWISTDGSVIEGQALRKIGGRWQPRARVTVPLCHVKGPFNA